MEVATLQSSCSIVGALSHCRGQSFYQEDQEDCKVYKIAKKEKKEAAKAAVFLLRSLALLASLAVFPDFAIVLPRRRDLVATLVLAPLAFSGILEVGRAQFPWLATPSPPPIENP